MNVYQYCSRLRRWLLYSCCWLVAGSSLGLARSPNLVIILTDDMGYADLRAFGPSEIPTPHLDRLAAEGTRCTHAYTAAPICVPARMALLSGRYPARFGIYNNTYLAEHNRIWLEQTTLADILKQSDYLNANVGKWHLSGNQKASTGDTRGGFIFKPPHERGFDEFVGITGGMDNFWPGTELARLSEGRYQRFPAPEYLTDFFGTEACEFIERHAAQPFFLYLAFNAPHAPLQALDEDQRNLEGPALSRDRRTYAAMIRAIDRNVGRVLDKLDTLKLNNETLVIFLNDNGGGGNNAAEHTRNTARNHPFRGHKFDLWEGGIRIPMILRWPGRIPAAGVFNELVSSMDLVPTVTALLQDSAASNTEALPAFDGVDLLPYLQHTRSGAPHDHLCWQQQLWPKPNERRLPAPSSGPYYQLAIRQGRWKAIKQDQPYDGRNSDRAWELYDLLQDPAELNDMASEFPEVVEDLQQTFFQWQAQMTPPPASPTPKAPR